MDIKFNAPTTVGKEIIYIKDAIRRGKISGNGHYTDKCETFLEKKFKVPKVLLTTSCTHALEMAALLLDIKSNDEIILPSFTFSSTVNAFLLRGAKPIFIDIRPDTLNIDECKIEKKITSRTKALVLIHYAGVACNMGPILKISKKYNIPIVEDSAQAMNAKYHSSYLGTQGMLGAFSFHETKNFYCGEGGAILINDTRLVEKAEILREKGTNRSKFFRGGTNQYEWVGLGSSYIMSELLAAFLYAQLENLENTQIKRQQKYEFYLRSLHMLEQRGVLRLPKRPKYSTPNYHTFYLLLNSHAEREALKQHLNKRGIMAIIHYVPLHSSAMGLSLNYTAEDLPITEEMSKKILRLPLYNDLSEYQQNYIVNQISNFFK